VKTRFEEISALFNAPLKQNTLFSKNTLTAEKNFNHIATKQVKEYKK